MHTLICLVAPVFGVILTGYLAGRFKMLGSDSVTPLNRFVFCFALPPALFVFMARAPFEKILNWPFIGAFAGGSLLTFLIALIAGRFWLRQDAASLAIAGLASAQGNTVHVGLPLLLVAYGSDGALPTIVATLCIVVLLICGVILVLETAGASNQSASRVALRSARTVLCNPLVISPLLGILFSAAALPLPKAASNYLDLMAAAVGPAALFSLGLSLIDRKLTGSVGEVIWLAALKAIVNPILTLALVTYVFAMDPLWSRAAVILSAMPSGVNAFVIAQQYKVHAETVSSTVVVSTGFSAVTISLLVIWLGIG